VKVGVTCDGCGHRDQWDMLITEPGTVRVTCMGCKELLDVEITQRDLDRMYHRLPKELSAWAGTLRP
jgi:hypothetical protein